MPWSTACAVMVVAGSLLTGSGVHADSIYRYNDKGLITYGDSLPIVADDEDDGHAVLNYQGVVVEKIPDRKQRLRAKKEALQKERDAVRDKTLLATFTSEEDLLNTREDRIGMLDDQIDRLDERIRLLQEQLDEVNKQIEQQPDAKPSFRESLDRDKSSLELRMDNAWSLLEARLDSRNKIAAKFDNDMVRYRELKAEH